MGIIIPIAETVEINLADSGSVPVKLNFPFACYPIDQRQMDIHGIRTQVETQEIVYPEPIPVVLHIDDVGCELPQTVVLPVHLGIDVADLTVQPEPASHKLEKRIR